MTDDEKTNEAEPLRPRRPQPVTPYTHRTFAFRRVGKRWGVYREVGVATAPPCEHCGRPYSGKVKIYVDRMIAFGGATGGFLLTANDARPPELKRDFPGQQEFVESDILPES
jgi:hypothetical protein